MKRIDRTISCIKEIASFLRPMQLSLHSAYTSFFLVLSLFPGLLLLLGLLRYTTLDVKDLMALIEDWLPQSLLPTVRSLVEASYRHSSGTVVTLSVVGALYSASRGMYGIRNGLDAIYGSTHSHGYLRRRGSSVVYNLSFLAVLVFTLLLYLSGNALLDYLWMTTHPLVLMILSLIDLRMVLLLIVQSAVFTVMYALLPQQRNRLRHSLPGALCASIGWLVFTHLFSIYVEYFTTYSNIYGSIYALALGMLWLYFCIFIFFCGGALNRALQKLRK